MAPWAQCVLRKTLNKYHLCDQFLPGQIFQRLGSVSSPLSFDKGWNWVDILQSQPKPRFVSQLWKHSLVLRDPLNPREVRPGFDAVADMVFLAADNVIAVVQVVVTSTRRRRSMRRLSVRHFSSLSLSSFTESYLLSFSSFFCFSIWKCMIDAANSLRMPYGLLVKIVSRVQKDFW